MNTTFFSSITIDNEEMDVKVVAERGEILNVTDEATGLEVEPDKADFERLEKKSLESAEDDRRSGFPYMVI